jgi:hypothetical protein
MSASKDRKIVEMHTKIEQLEADLAAVRALLMEAYEYAPTTVMRRIDDALAGKDTPC